MSSIGALIAVAMVYAICLGLVFLLFHEERISDPPLGEVLPSNLRSLAYILCPFALLGIALYYVGVLLIALYLHCKYR